MPSLTQSALEKLFAAVKVGGFTVVWPDGTKRTYGPDRSEFTLTIKDPRAISLMVRNISLGFGESYMDGLIDIEGDLRDVIALPHRNRAAFPQYANRSFFKLMRGVTLGVKPAAQRKAVQHHYDIGNAFYELWLDETMSYSCAYFKQKTDPLAKAQRQKIDHTLRKLQLRPGQRLLDIGCGWGWLIITAAKQYKVKATGISQSAEQVKKVKERIKAEGLEHLVEVKLADYRELTGSETYDRIVSVGMFEHVGRPHHDEYFAAVSRLIKPGGISVLHTITTDYERPTDPWIAKYIFPSSYIPSWREVIAKLPDHSLHLTDVESLRIHYAMTLDHWGENFEKNLDKVRTMFDERFVRMWRLYLAASGSSFRNSGLDLHQFVFTKGLNNDLPLTREFLYK
ncbi:class I SAM-dependent methyltransferase [Candidatus Berkelbacteria bacterium]|nr:class I SAM-dependent methyltransferase [Candidatus Berkelbacteria bacterium]